MNQTTSRLECLSRLAKQDLEVRQETLDMEAKKREDFNREQHRIIDELVPQAASLVRQIEEIANTPDLKQWFENIRVDKDTPNLRIYSHRKVHLGKPDMHGRHPYFLIHVANEEVVHPGDPITRAPINQREPFYVEKIRGLVDPDFQEGVAMFFQSNYTGALWDLRYCPVRQLTEKTIKRTIGGGIKQRVLHTDYKKYLHTLQELSSLKPDDFFDSLEKELKQK